MLHSTFLEPGILRWPLHFCTVCAPLVARCGAVGWGTALQAGRFAGSIPDGVIGIIHNPSCRTMTLRLTQPLRKWLTGILPGGKGKKVKAVCESYSTDALRHIVLLLEMSSFIHPQRRCTHQAAWETSASEGRNYTWNSASNPWFT